MNSSLEPTDGIRNESRQVTQHTSPLRQEDIDDPPTAEGSPAGSINFQAMAPILQHSDGGTPEGSSGHGAFTQQQVQQSDDFINDLVEDLNNGRTTAPRVGHNKSDTDEGEGKSSDKECSDNDDDEDELMNQLYAAASRDSDIDVNKTVGKGKNKKPSNRDDPPSSDGGGGSSSAESDESSSNDESDSDEDDDASDTTPMKKKKAGSSRKHTETKKKKGERPIESRESNRMGLRNKPTKSRKYGYDDSSFAHKKSDSGQLENEDKLLFEESVDNYDVESMNRLRKRVKKYHLADLQSAYNGGQPIFQVLQTIGQDPKKNYEIESFKTLHLIIEQMRGRRENWSAVKKFLSDEKVTPKSDGVTTAPSHKYSELVYGTNIDYAAGNKRHAGKGGAKGTKAKSSK